MDAPSSSSSPQFNSALVSDTWWSSFNPGGAAADFVVTMTLSDLPLGVRNALARLAPVRASLGAEDVNWNVTCFSLDGTALLRDTVFLDGGSRSGRSCGENDLWAGTPPGNVKDRNKPIPRGSLAFGYRKAVYLIDGGLCPCRRCCQTLLGLATRLESIIVVRPMTDYEMIDKRRTPLMPDQSFVLVFEPDALVYTVYHTSVDEAPFVAGPRDVTRDPVRAWFVCPNPSCSRNFTVVFTSSFAKSRAIKISSFLGINEVQTPVIRCDNRACGYSLDLVQVADGKFPTRVIHYLG